jgi:hypothetical protein
MGAEQKPEPAGEYCAHVRPLFSEHADGEPLGFTMSALVRFHMLVCPPCRRFRRSLAATREALGALRDAELTEEIPKRDL